MASEAFFQPPWYRTYLVRMSKWTMYDVRVALAPCQRIAAASSLVITGPFPDLTSRESMDLMISTSVPRVDGYLKKALSPSGAHPQNSWVYPLHDWRGGAPWSL